MDYLLLFGIVFNFTNKLEFSDRAVKKQRGSDFAEFKRGLYNISQGATVSELQVNPVTLLPIKIYH